MLERLYTAGSEVLGHEAAEAAWDEGVVMSQDEATAYALEEPLLKKAASS